MGPPDCPAYPCNALDTSIVLVCAPNAGSTPSASSGTSGSPGSTCFSSSSQVSLANGDKIPVSQLDQGDQVETLNSDGEIVSSPFLGWLHRDEDLFATLPYRLVPQLLQAEVWNLLKQIPDALTASQSTVFIASVAPLALAGMKMKSG